MAVIQIAALAIRSGTGASQGGCRGQPPVAGVVELGGWQEAWRGCWRCNSRRSSACRSDGVWIDFRRSNDLCSYPATHP